MGTTTEWLGEAVEAAQMAPTVASPAVPVHKLSTFTVTRFSLEIQQDGLRVVESLREIIVDAANQATETAYATGTGVAEPRAIMIKGALMLAETTLGMIEASTTRRWPAARTLPRQC